MIMCLLFYVTLSTLVSISIALSCTSINTYNYVNGCTFLLVMFSSFAFICATCASIDCCSLALVCATCASIDYCSTALSSFNSSMNIESTDVVHGPSCSLACQLILCLRKNSTTNVLILYIS